MFSFLKEYLISNGNFLYAIAASNTYDKFEVSDCMVHLSIEALLRNLDDVLIAVPETINKRIV